MRRLSNRHKRLLREAFDHCLLKAGIELNEREEATVQSEFGSVYVSLHDDWVHFRLNDFDNSDGRFFWRGFRHWKQNYHTFITQLHPRERDAAIQQVEGSLATHMKRIGLMKEVEVSA